MRSWRAGLKKRDVRARAVDISHGCAIQYTGWPCGTCFGAARPERVTPDDWAEIWRAVLAFRGDYESYRTEQDGEHGHRLVVRIEFEAHGNFLRHVFGFRSDQTLRTLVERFMEVTA